VGVGYLMVLQAYTSRRSDLTYGFVEQGALSAPLSPGPVNLPNPVSQLPAGSYNDNTLMPLYAFTGIVNLWDVIRNNEVLEAFIGVAPSPLRVSVKQPTGTLTIALDQGVVPLSGTVPVPDLRSYDGFASPFGYPDDVSLLHTLKGVSANFLLINPVLADQNPNGVYPRFNLMLNRMAAFPVSDPTMVRRIVEGKEPARWITLGTGFDTEVAIARSAYGCGRFQRTIFQSANWQEKLTKLGYAPTPEGG
jgi:hypothetical protein